jgi:DNA-binding response OmpR family regulator
MKSILIVDDEPLLAEVLKDELESAGYHTVCAASANEALAEIARGTIDLVLSDVRMPFVSGVELLTSIRARWPERPYVILMSGLTDTQTMAALASGAQAVLGKPICCDELRCTVAELLEGPKERSAPPGFDRGSADVPQTG